MCCAAPSSLSKGRALDVELVPLDSFGDDRDEQRGGERAPRGRRSRGARLPGRLPLLPGARSAPILGEAGLLAVAPTATFVRLGGPTLVRLMPHDGVGALAIAGWLARTGRRRAAGRPRPRRGLRHVCWLHVCRGGARPGHPRPEPARVEPRRAPGRGPRRRRRGPLRRRRRLRRRGPVARPARGRSVALAPRHRGRGRGVARARARARHRGAHPLLPLAAGPVRPLRVRGDGARPGRDRGRRDRAGAVAAALATKDRDSVLGRYSIDADGHTTTTAYGRLAVVDGSLVWDRSG